MNGEVKIVLPGKPEAWARRVQISRYHSYDPKGKQKKGAAWDIKRAVPSAPTFTGPVLVELYIFYPFPESYSERMKDFYESKPRPVKPDNDNFEKFYWDALVQAGILEDDNIITDNITRKRYSRKPCTVIKIKSLPNPETQYRKKYNLEPKNQ